MCVPLADRRNIDFTLIQFVFFKKKKKMQTEGIIKVNEINVWIWLCKRTVNFCPGFFVFSRCVERIVQWV